MKRTVMTILVVIVLSTCITLWLDSIYQTWMQDSRGEYVKFSFVLKPGERRHIRIVSDTPVDLSIDSVRRVEPKPK